MSSIPLCRSCSRSFNPISNSVVPSLFGCFTGTTTKYTSSRRLCRSCGYRLSPGRLVHSCFQSAMRSPVSRACNLSTCLGPLTTWGSHPRLASYRLSLYDPLSQQGRHPSRCFSKLKTQPKGAFVRASARASRRAPQDSFIPNCMPVILALGNFYSAAIFAENVIDKRSKSR
jgi:hypothetical protein